MNPSPVTDLRTFVPAKDLEVSKAFYTELGFTVNWSNDEIAEVQVGSSRFLLQRFYVAEHAGNFMMSLSVEDADSWWEHIQHREITKKYSGIMTHPASCGTSQIRASPSAAADCRCWNVGM